MDFFNVKNGELCAEEIPLRAVASRFGTPSYVYSRATLERHVRAFKEAFAPMPHHVCYAIKANGNLALLQLLKQAGCYFDAVSLGELFSALKIGAKPEQIILSGVGKSDEEIQRGIEADVLYLSAESENELRAIADCARKLAKKARVCIRINPNIDARTHHYISTGLSENKFGVPIDQALALYKEALTWTSVELVGVGCHIGSQITDIVPFMEAATSMRKVIYDLQKQGVPLRYVSMGGGLGVPYNDEEPPSPIDYSAALRQTFNDPNLTLILEPGRAIAGNAGVLLTRVIRRKNVGAKNFLILDAGMNDLLRPALYDARHRIEPVVPLDSGNELVDVVGPVCESADTFAKNVELPPLQVGDLVILRTAGAYGMSMSSTYNGRPRPAEVLCDGGKMTLIRERDTLPSLWQGHKTLDGVDFDGTVPKL